MNSLNYASGQQCNTIIGSFSNVIGEQSCYNTILGAKNNITGTNNIVIGCNNEVVGNNNIIVANNYIHNGNNLILSENIHNSVKETTDYLIELLYGLRQKI